MRMFSLGETSPVGGEIVDLHDHHVAGVTPAAGKEPARGGAVVFGNDDLEQSIANRVEAVSQPEVADAGIAIADLEIESIGDRLLGRSKVGGDRDELTKSHHGLLASTVNHRRCRPVHVFARRVAAAGPSRLLWSYDRQMVRLGDCTTEEIGETRVLLLPLGSTEQHGPHLPSIPTP
jgi:hypothetical protein